MSYSSDLWDSFETVSSHARSGKKLCAVYTKFVDDFAKLSKEYQAKLVRLCKVADEDFGTLNTAWGTLKVELENMAQGFHVMAEEVVFKAKGPVELHLKETAKSRRKITDTGKKLINEYTAQVKTVYECRDSYEKSMKTYETTEGEYNQLSTHNELVNTNKVTKKLAADKKKCEGADKRYRKAIEKVTVLEAKMYDTEMPHLLEQIEALERQRIEVVKGSIGAFSTAVRNLAPTIGNVCDTIDQSVAAVSPTADIAQFCAAKQTGKTKEERTVYEPFSSELQRCVRPGGDRAFAAPAASSSLTSSQSTAAPSSMSSSRSLADVQRQPAAAAAAAPAVVAPAQSMPVVKRSQPAASSPPPSHGIGKCRGLHDYAALNETELSFRAGDVITILDKDASGWWKGELNGNVGFFPSVEWVEEISAGGGGGGGHARDTPSAAAPYSPPEQYSAPPAQRQCRALYDMEAQNENELTLTAGEMLLVTTEVDGWFIGQNMRGQQGMFPCNYVELV